jgi:hypothetical protein
MWSGWMRAIVALVVRHLLSLLPTLITLMIWCVYIDWTSFPHDPGYNLRFRHHLASTTRNSWSGGRERQSVVTHTNSRLSEPLEPNCSTGGEGRVESVVFPPRPESLVSAHAISAKIAFAATVAPGVWEHSVAKSLALARIASASCPMTTSTRMGPNSDAVQRGAPCLFPQRPSPKYSILAPKS